MAKAPRFSISRTMGGCTCWDTPGISHDSQGVIPADWATGEYTQYDHRESVIVMAQADAFRFHSSLLNNGFGVGATRYADHYPGEEGTARIVIRAIPEGGDTMLMIVDTGAPWCVIDPELADAWGLVSVDAYQPEMKLHIRGDAYRGRLVQVQIELQADVGQNLTVPATAFIPELDPGQMWNLPNFIGLTGLLERVRFAVDASENAFYFGPANV
jgi:hypothetical protein